MEVVAFTDGACSGNPGPGGWGVVLREMAGDIVARESHFWGGAAATTNNQMELTALREALALAPAGGAISIFSDSEYSVKGLREWLPGWKARGWRTSSGSAVKNADLWREIDALAAARRVDLRWVRGHAGQPGNELADALSRRLIGRNTRAGEQVTPPI